MPDLRQLLRAGAGEPIAPFDADDIRERARGHRRRTIAASVGATTVAIVVAVALVAQLGPTRTKDLVVESSPTPAAASPTPAVTPSEDDGPWRKIAEAPITPRGSAAAVWSGDEVFVWGGMNFGDRQGESFERVPYDDGAAYNPALDEWERLPASPLSARWASHATWTGNEMLVWGGFDHEERPLTDGAMYDPGSGTWRAMASFPLGPRTGAAVQWTGQALVVWGGHAPLAPGYQTYADGAAYDPRRDEWSVLPESPLGPRTVPASVWTGSELLIIGGRYSGQPNAYGVSDDVAAFDPATRTWTTKAPIPHEMGDTPLEPGFNRETSSVWDGSVALVGLGSARPGIYDPAADEWRFLTRPPEAASRGSGTGVDGFTTTWTGDDAIIVGGNIDFDDDDPKGREYGPLVLHSTTRDWYRLPSAPLERADSLSGHVAVWADGLLVVWGGTGGPHYPPRRIGGAILALPPVADLGDPERPTRAPVVECPTNTPMEGPGDVDGDGVPELVGHSWLPDKDLYVVTCIADGRQYEVLGLGMGEILDVVDVENDGKDEIAFGGTWCCGAGTEFVVFRDPVMIHVTLQSGESFGVVNGEEPAGNLDSEPEVPESMRSWGCSDVDGDGTPEIVQNSAERRAATLKLETTGFDIATGVAVQVFAETHEVPLPPNHTPGGLRRWMRQTLETEAAPSCSEDD